jgi:oxygen-independent coproporphyrinogen-3 oxidase
MVKGMIVMPFKKLLESCEILLDEMHIDNLRNLGLDRTLESYFLVGPYPPLMQMDEYRWDELSLGLKGNKKNEFVDLYIHFPFCRIVGKYECPYCPFYKEKYKPSVEHEVVRNWIKEIELYKKVIGEFKVSTIYFGGGSVSLITPENLRTFVDYLFQKVGCEEISEVKFEIHADSSKEPEKLHEILDILKEFKNLKLIIDIQSLNPQTLNYASWGRVSSEAYFQTLNIVIETGFKHICTGLILGLPFETPESFLEGVSKLITIPEIEMLNIYPLMFKECDHVFGDLKQSPEIMFDVKTRDVVYLAARKLLRSFDFSESPIYFYSRGNTEPIHQRKKLESESSMIAIGPSAFGHINSPDLNVAYYNHPSVIEYSNQLNQERLPFWKTYALNEDSKHIRQIIKGKLNMLKEFNINMLSGSLKEKLEVTLNIFQLHGLLEKKSGEWVLTEKGTLRVEEMSYYLAEIDLGPKLKADISETLKSRYHCFPNRTEEQVLKWKFEYQNYARLTKGGN